MRGQYCPGLGLHGGWLGLQRGGGGGRGHGGDREIQAAGGAQGQPRQRYSTVQYSAVQADLGTKPPVAKVSLQTSIPRDNLFNFHSVVVRGARHCV